MPDSPTAQGLRLLVAALAAAVLAAAGSVPAPVPAAAALPALIQDIADYVDEHGTLRALPGGSGADPELTAAVKAEWTAVMEIFESHYGTLPSTGRTGAQAILYSAKVTSRGGAELDGHRVARAISEMDAGSRAYFVSDTEVGKWLNDDSVEEAADIATGGDGKLTSQLMGWGDKSPEAAKVPGDKFCLNDGVSLKFANSIVSEDVIALIPMGLDSDLANGTLRFSHQG
jgi:hypothetical protein